MTGYMTKALFILLVYVLHFRTYLKWAKNLPKKIKPIIAGIIAIGAGTAAAVMLSLSSCKSGETGQSIGVISSADNEMVVETTDLDPYDYPAYQLPNTIFIKLEE